MAKRYQNRRNLFKKRKQVAPVFQKQMNKTLSTTNKVPFGCNACNFSSFSIRKFILHIKENHYVPGIADKGSCSNDVSDTVMLNQTEGETAINETELSANKDVTQQETDNHTIIKQENTASNDSIHEDNENLDPEKEEGQPNVSEEENIIPNMSASTDCDGNTGDNPETINVNVLSMDPSNSLNENSQKENYDPIQSSDAVASNSLNSLESTDDIDCHDKSRSLSLNKDENTDLPHIVKSMPNKEDKDESNTGEKGKKREKEEENKDQESKHEEIKEKESVFEKSKNVEMPEERRVEGSIVEEIKDKESSDKEIDGEISKIAKRKDKETLVKQNIVNENKDKEMKDTENKDNETKDEKNKDEKNKDEKNKDEKNKDEKNKDEKNKDEKNKDEGNKNEENKDTSNISPEITVERILIKESKDNNDIGNESSAMDITMPKPLQNQSRKSSTETGLPKDRTSPKNKGCRLNLENIVHNLKDNLNGSLTQPNLEGSQESSQKHVLPVSTIENVGSFSSTPNLPTICASSRPVRKLKENYPSNTMRESSIGNLTSYVASHVSNTETAQGRFAPNWNHQPQPSFQQPNRHQTNAAPGPAAMIATVTERGVVTMPNMSVISYIDSNPKIQALLFHSFCKFPYPPVEEVYYLSNTTQLSVSQIKNWFVGTRLKHGISWSPDEVMEAWSCISGQGVQTPTPPNPPVPNMSVQGFRAQPMVPTCTNPVGPAPRRLSQTMRHPNMNTPPARAMHPEPPMHSMQGNGMMTPRFPINPQAVLWMTCNCGLEHELNGSQIGMLNSMGDNLTAMPTKEVLTKAQKVTRLPHCAVQSFFQGKCEINNKEGNGQIRKPSRKRPRKVSLDVSPKPVATQQAGPSATTLNSATEQPEGSVLSIEGLDILYQSFCIEPYLSNEELQKIKLVTGLSKLVIRTYFINKRKEVLKKLRAMAAKRQHIAIYENYHTWVKDINTSRGLHQQAMKSLSN